MGLGFLGAHASGLAQRVEDGPTQAGLEACAAWLGLGFRLGLGLELRLGLGLGSGP